MDLVDEEDVSLVDIGEDGGQVARSLDGRSARRVDADAELAGHDVGERRLAEAGRSVQQDVVRGLAPDVGGGEQDPEVVLDLRLADVLTQVARPERRLDTDLVRQGKLGCDGPGVVLHGRRV